MIECILSEESKRHTLTGELCCESQCLTAPSLTCFPLDVHQEPSHDIYGIIILDNGIMMDKVLCTQKSGINLKYVRSYLCVSVSTETFLQA